MKTEVLKKLWKVCNKNLPTILTVVAVVGVVGTVICTIEAAPKAKEELDKLKDPKIINKVKTVAPIYAPTIGLGCLTIACIITSNYESTRRYTALLGSYAIAKNQFGDYKDKVSKIFGKDANSKVNEEMAKDQVNSKISTNDKLIMSPDQDIWCKDVVTGKLFKSNMLKLQRAANKVNNVIFLEGRANLEYFYELLSEDAPEIAKNVYWDAANSKYNMMDIEFDAEINDNMMPILTFSYNYNADKWAYFEL